MEIDLRKLNYTDSIDIDTKVEFSNDYLKDSGINGLDNVYAKGTIKSDMEYNYDVNINLSGVMTLTDAITGEEVPYEFNTEIEEKLENSLITLDLIEFLWQYIVLEIPMRFTLSNEEISIHNKDYQVISEEEYKKEKNNPFKDFHL